MIIADASAAHLAAFYGAQPKRTCRAWVVLDGARVLGVCGYYAQGLGNVVFTEITPELRRHPRVLVAAGWKVMAYLIRIKRPIFAHCDSTVAASERFLQHFGFARQPNGVFTWLG